MPRVVPDVVLNVGSRVMSTTTSTPVDPATMAPADEGTSSRAVVEADGDAVEEMVVGADVDGAAADAMHPQPKGS